MKRKLAYAMPVHRICARMVSARVPQSRDGGNGRPVWGTGKTYVLIKRKRFTPDDSILYLKTRLAAATSSDFTFTLTFCLSFDRWSNT